MDNISGREYRRAANHFQSKYWNNPNGWRELVIFLKAKGYRAICIDQKPTVLVRVGGWHPGADNLGLHPHNEFDAPYRVKKLIIPLPPLQKQDQVTATVENAFARADRLEAEAARNSKLLNRLESAILAKAFRD